MAFPTQKQVLTSQTEGDWKVSNQVLYDLCKRYPSHKSPQEIIAKVMLIGRTYAAAIERRKTKDRKNSDDFYINKVAPQILKSNIDDWISSVGLIQRVDFETAAGLLDAHFKVTQLFSRISGLEKRSLASKYLHFHLPEHFFIYDSRASTSSKCLSEKLPEKKDWLSSLRINYDKEYAEFVWRCLYLREAISKKYKRVLTPREIDNLFLFATRR